MTRRTLDEDGAAVELLERFGDEAEKRGEPVWLELRSAADGRLEAHRVTASRGLFGRRVRPAWSAAGVVGTGRFRLLEESHEPPAVLIPGLAGGLRMACVVSRRGRTGWQLRLPDGSSYNPVPELGLMLDTLRRSVEVPTAPPPASNVVLQVVTWLETIVDRCHDDDLVRPTDRLDWNDVLSLHPLLSDIDGLSNDEAEEVARTFAIFGDWEMMRASALGRGAPGFGISPQLAAWMDTGMFARYVIDGLPSVEGLIDMARPGLTPAAGRRLRHLVRELLQDAEVPDRVRRGA